MSYSVYGQAKRREKSSDLRPLWRLLPFLLPYKRQIVYAAIALLFASLATLVVPLALRNILDYGFSDGGFGLVDQYFVGMIVVVATLAISSALRFYYVMWVGERIVANVRAELFRHLLTLTPEFYENQRTGEVMSRLTADTTLLKSAFSSTASVALRNSVMFIGSLIMMIYTSPMLSGIASLAIPLIVVPLVVYGRRVRKLSRQAQDALAASSAFAQERISAISTVQANTQEPLTFIGFESENEKSFGAAAKRTKGRAFLTFAIILVSMGATVALMWFGARNVMAGTMTGGTLAQFALYAMFAASALGQLSEVYGEVQMAAGASERISEILDEVPKVQGPTKPAVFTGPVQGRVVFKAVNFSYPSRPNTLALGSASFIAEPGEVTAIVGPSGAGKTTIFQVLQRFHDVQSGAITIDGVPIAKLSLEELRSNIAIVSQDPVIFSGTVSENIRFGSPHATQEQIIEAAKAARVDDFAIELPNGYDSLLGERGVMLSGGQRQRISIARAILRNAPILLLDEATSALDSESEALIQKALAKLTKGRTTLVIAHRLATVRNANQILVMDRGKILTHGTHSQLVKSNALYARLAKLQFNAP